MASVTEALVLSPFRSKRQSHNTPFSRIFSAPSLRIQSILELNKLNNKQGTKSFNNNYSSMKTQKILKVNDDYPNDVGSIIPGLCDDIAKHCLALVPRESFQSMGAVSKKWRKWVQSREFCEERRICGTSEEWLYVCNADPNGKSMPSWQAFDPLKGKWLCLPPMPGPPRTAFGHVVLHGKLLIIAGLVQEGGASKPSSDVLQYDASLNRWCTLPSMTHPRYEFGCAVVDGVVYAIGGRGCGGEQLSSVESYDHEKQKWSFIRSLRSPRWGAFACELQGKVYVMGGRSKFSIGYSKMFEVYDPKLGRWESVKGGGAMVVSNAVLDGKLCCIEWKSERELAVFDPSKTAWTKVAVPFPRSLNVSFCFGTFQGKLILFSTKKVSYYKTLAFDPNADISCQWNTIDIVPLGHCICTATITL